MNIYENTRIQRKIAGKLRGYSYKKPISQFLTELQVKTWYKNDADTLHRHLVV